jgi:hypothetical protein
MARKKNQGKSKKRTNLNKDHITEKDRAEFEKTFGYELYDGPTRGKRGFGLEPDFTPAGKFPVPIDPAEKRLFPSSLKEMKLKRRFRGEERAREAKRRFARREARRTQALTDALENNYGFNDADRMSRADLDDRKEMRGGGAAIRGTKFSKRSN